MPAELLIPMNDFFNPLADFFATLTNEQTIFLGILSLLVFAFGVVVGWILQGMKTRRYKKELLLLRTDRDEYERRYQTANRNQQATAQELEAVSREKVAALEQLQQLRLAQQQQEAQQQQYADQIEALQADLAQELINVKNLEAEVQGLREENTRLREQEVTSGLSEVSGELPRSVTDDEVAVANYIAHSEYRFQQLEARLLALTAENTAAGDVGPAQSPGFGTHQAVVPPPVEVDAEGEPLVIRADITEPGVRTGEQGKTKVVVQTTPSVQLPMTGQPIAPENHDDLTRINNIGPFLQARLHEHDIYRYDQIARWSEADIATYTELVGYLPGVIKRDDWVGQAKVLAEAVPTTASTATFAVEKENEESGITTTDDDLRRIEGIGSSIAAVLQKAGINTFEILAATEVEKIKEILAAAGGHFKSHNPRTWPAQAGLAADDKFEELKAWQQELKGGN